LSFGPPVDVFQYLTGERSCEGQYTVVPREGWGMRIHSRSTLAGPRPSIKQPDGGKPIATKIEFEFPILDAEILEVSFQQVGLDQIGRAHV
jgi:hypothetical protein